jgi:hypothetical protein
MARRRGLGGVAYTKQDLKSQAKACGSHYFDPGSMRFFNARLVAVYPAGHGKGGKTYFVESKGGERRGAFQSIPRHYQIGVFKNCQVQTIGKGIGRGKQTGVYNSSAKAKRVASAIASKAGGYFVKPLRKRRRR